MFRKSTQPINEPTSELPGNTGCRTLDQMMPTSLDTVFKPRKSTIFNIAPKLLAQGHPQDQLTDDEDSDHKEDKKTAFPSLESFLKDFESDSKIMSPDNGLSEMSELLNDNIDLQRKLLATRLPSMISQINQAVQNREMKLNLR